jgi:hypothetical protein
VRHDDHGGQDHRREAQVHLHAVQLIHLRPSFAVTGPVRVTRVHDTRSVPSSSVRPVALRSATAASRGSAAPRSRLPADRSAQPAGPAHRAGFRAGPAPPGAGSHPAIWAGYGRRTCHRLQPTRPPARGEVHRLPPGPRSTRAAVACGGAGRYRRNEEGRTGRCVAAVGGVGCTAPAARVGWLKVST